VVLLLNLEERTTRVSCARSYHHDHDNSCNGTFDFFPRQPFFAKKFFAASLPPATIRSSWASDQLSSSQDLCSAQDQKARRHCVNTHTHTHTHTHLMKEI